MVWYGVYYGIESMIPMNFFAFSLRIPIGVNHDKHWSADEAWNLLNLVQIESTSFKKMFPDEDAIVKIVVFNLVLIII